MVYGRYNYGIHGVYNPTFTSLGGTIVYPGISIIHGGSPANITGGQIDCLFERAIAGFAILPQPVFTSPLRRCEGREGPESNGKIISSNGTVDQFP